MGEDGMPAYDALKAQVTVLGQQMAEVIDVVIGPQVVDIDGNVSRNEDEGLRQLVHKLNTDGVKMRLTKPAWTFLGTITTGVITIVAAMIGPL